MSKVISVGDVAIANDKPFVLLGGMNVLESRDMAMQVPRPTRVSPQS